MMETPFESVRHDVDVCVVGGGMAGICAAMASARSGAKTLLVHDRPVLGGNASSEVRMWICGAHGPNTKETGILEEIQLENCYRNPSANYSIWDSVLYEKVHFCRNLTTLLNASCCGGTMEEGLLRSIRAWQLTTQVWHEVEAKIFIDCSGDSVLAPITDAEVRWGRESREEFGEDIAPAVADRRTMGNSLLLQLRETDEPRPFTPPRWAYRFDEASHLPGRLGNGAGHNFWWLELGGIDDTIRDAESIRDELMRVGYGVWDFLKNRWTQRSRLENWELDWKGSLPGKRENRRYVGPHLLTQHDIRDGGAFEDVIAYGGWSMDDHHPAGLLYPGKATLFHPAPSPYGIPYRSLFSVNVPNLMFAGRNISTTHVALSSTRVMATCALLGQAAGMAAALAIEAGLQPAGLAPGRIPELQDRLMEADCWLPGFRRTPSPLTRAFAFDRDAGPSAECLRNGVDRPIGKEGNGLFVPLGQSLTIHWPSAVHVGGLRLVFDSNLGDRKKMLCRYPKGERGLRVPASMTRAFRVEGRVAGTWETVYRSDCHYQRLATLPVNRSVDALRVVPEETWGAEAARIFSIDVEAVCRDQIELPPAGRHWSEVVAEIDPEDLRPPDSGLEETARGDSRVGA